MISKEKFKHINFIQTDFSCVLASYAVASQAFITPRSVIDYFVAFCVHYGITTNNINAEKDYVKKFDIECKKVSGYTILDHLHHRSALPLFLECRNEFDLEFVDVNKSGREYTDILMNEEACLLAFINHSCEKRIRDSHSITIFFDKGLFVYDTNYPEPYEIKNLSSLGEIGDCFILKRRIKT